MAPPPSRTSSIRRAIISCFCAARAAMSNAGTRPATIKNEPAQFLRRAEAAQRLQGCRRLRSGGVAADSGRYAGLPILRDSELGRPPRGPSPDPWLSHSVDPGVGL